MANIQIKSEKLTPFWRNPQYNLKIRKVKRRVKTTDSTHDLPLYPNIVKDLLPSRPCQLIVSDITYIPYYLDPESGEYKFCYLALITDYYTKEIVGYSVAPTLESIYAILRACLHLLSVYSFVGTCSITSCNSITSYLSSSLHGTGYCMKSQHTNVA